MLDWNDLRVVRAVARAGTLSAAARALGMHQTTVGRRLRVAEDALGVPLFLRSAAGASPTPAGQRLLSSLESLGGAVEALERQARGLVEGSGGLVRLAVTENTARLIVPTALRELRERHPEIAVELVPGNVPIDLARGEADLAVRTVAAEEADIVRRRLGEVRYGLYASARYLKQRGAAPEADQLAGHDVLVPSRELASGPEATWVAARAGRASPVFYASSHVTIAGAAAAGMGLAVLPDNLARLHRELVRVRPLPEIPARPVWLVMHRDLRRVSRVRAVAEAVAGAIAATLV